MPRVKHYFEQGHYYHITTRTRNGVFAFASPQTKRVVADALAFYRERGDWRLHAFVIMANHVHCAVSETGTGLSAVVGNFKKWISNHLGREVDGELMERRFDDNAIQGHQEMRGVVAYIHDNPVRVGLVRRAEDYFWSSARNYAGLEPVAMEVDMQW